MSKIRHVYFAQESGPEGLVKIGASSNPPRRTRAIAARIGRDVTLLGVLLGLGYRGERAVHRMLAEARRPDADLPTTEWFEPTEEVMALIASRARPYIEPKKVKPRDMCWLERFIKIGCEPMVAPDEAADFIGDIDAAGLRRLAREGKVPHYRPGRSSRIFRFKITELADWKRQRSAA